MPACPPVPRHFSPSFHCVPVALSSGPPGKLPISFQSFPLLPSYIPSLEREPLEAGLQQQKKVQKKTVSSRWKLIIRREEERKETEKQMRKKFYVTMLSAAFRGLRRALRFWRLTKRGCITRVPTNSMLFLESSPPPFGQRDEPFPHSLAGGNCGRSGRNRTASMSPCQEAKGTQKTFSKGV
jgi:hypothetical protein